MVVLSYSVLVLLKLGYVVNPCILLSASNELNWKLMWLKNKTFPLLTRLESYSSLLLSDMSSFGKGH